MTTSRMTASVVTVAYLCTSVILALFASRKSRSSNDYLNATGSLPTLIATVSFLIGKDCGGARRRVVAQREQAAASIEADGLNGGDWTIGERSQGAAGLVVFWRGA